MSDQNHAELGALDRYFGISEAGSTVGREVLGGVTTFLTMAYIVFIQPAFLSAAGMDAGAVLVATCLSAALATLTMGLWARHPVALAPGMGLNAFFAFTVCGALGIPWQEALALVFVSGAAFLVLGLVGLRQRIVAWVPVDLRHAIAAGIGLFIAFIGLKEGGLIVLDPNTFVGVGDLASRRLPVPTAGSGFVVAAVLYTRQVPGALLAGIATSAVVALATGLTEYTGLVAAPPSLAPTFLQLSFENLFTPERMGLALLFLYTDLFDTVGTLMAVGTRAGLMKEGQLIRGDRAFLSDAVGTVAGSLLGTSTVTSYIESTAGVEAGARTGLASVVTGVLFAGAVFLHPVVQLVGAGVPVEVSFFTSGGPAAQTLVLHPITAPALLVVGALMAQSLGEINWRDPVVSIAAFMTVVGIPLTFSIADGISLGLVTYSGLALASGRKGDAVGLHLLAVVLLARWMASVFGMGG